MKTLSLVRHAKSSWKDPELKDFDRPLNKRGKRDLPGLAERAEQLTPLPDLILSSGAKRAITTARALHKRLGLAPEQLLIIPELYEACAETLLYILQQLPGQITHAMLVGHNPGLETLGELLTRQEQEKFPTAALLHMHLSITRWEELAAGCATPMLFDYPKKHLQPA